MTTEVTNDESVICAAKLTVNHVNMFLARQSLQKLSAADGFLAGKLVPESYAVVVYVEMGAFKDTSNEAWPRDCMWAAVLFDTKNRTEK